MRGFCAANQSALLPITRGFEAVRQISGEDSRVGGSILRNTACEYAGRFEELPTSRFPRLDPFVPLGALGSIGSSDRSGHLEVASH